MHVVPDMQRRLNSERFAALVASGFDEGELDLPRRSLERLGGRVELVSPKKDFVRGWERTDWGAEHAVDRHVGDADHRDYAGLLVPGGLLSPDYLRMDQRAIDLVRQFAKNDKPIAALGHAAWLLIEADVIEGRRITSFPSLRTDAENAGARWLDEPLVIDGPILTVRRQDDLPLVIEQVLAHLTRRVDAPERARLSV